MDTFTLSTLRAHILFRAHAKAEHLDPSTNTAATGNTNLDTIINLVKDQIVAAHNWSWRVGHFQFTPQAAEFEMPVNFGSLIYMTIQDYRLNPMSVQEFRSRYQDGDDSGTPRWYIPWGGLGHRARYRIYPFSSTQVFIDYNLAFPDLKQAQDTLTVTVGIPEGIVGLFQKALVEGVLAEVFDYQNDDAKSTKAERKYMGYISQLIQEDSDRSEVQELERHGDLSIQIGRLGPKYGE